MDKPESGGGFMGRLKKLGTIASVAAVGLGAAALALSLQESGGVSWGVSGGGSGGVSGEGSGEGSIDQALRSPRPYKMNTDGSCRSNPYDPLKRGPSGFGGILRDERGKWVQGFIGFIGISDGLTSEFHGIHRGLLLLDKYGHKESILESDCQAAIDWINGESECPPPRNTVYNSWDIIEECRHLKAKNQIDIRWCPEDANKCADKLAYMGVEKREPYIEITEVPYEIKDRVDQESMTMCQN